MIIAAVSASVEVPGLSTAGQFATSLPGQFLAVVADLVQRHRPPPGPGAVFCLVVAAAVVIIWGLLGRGT